ncbi:uncharacterized protein K489DRAFT_375548 [Dissoconium aciculare CBS 342.82]|uniref:Uncharacterized protein n=1 Tax=Dissoconium aciculare CBS 342.82 TaxID=1314786 RepID=A0A6J3MIB9_9PEZI|nr:uncharacterized protein K489DRAFT_375548 [Dissoconium aciculare CBS 342.82]KAF1827449.1 hypothetical protein K489DRAFT_375548 [Dissoconium aciculare CBS 342.82]
MSIPVWMLGLISYSLGTAMTLATIAYMFSQFDRMGETVDPSRMRISSAVGLVLCSISTLPCITIFAWSWLQLAASREGVTDTRRSSHFDEFLSKSPLKIRLSSLSTPSLFSRRAASIPAVSSITVSEPSEGRETRAMSSNAKLPSTSTSCDNEETVSIFEQAEAVQRANEFATWEASAPFEAPDATSGRKLCRPALETIPGSRPVSPSDPRDGPFDGTVIISPVEDESHPLASLTSAIETNSTRQLSRSASPWQSISSSDQAHIHPLFRSESPIPPPFTSPGTIITASPYAGQVIGPDHALASRFPRSPHGSRPASPNPSMIPSRQGSSSRNLSVASLSIPTAAQPSRSLTGLSTTSTPSG